MRPATSTPRSVDRRLPGRLWLCLSAAALPAVAIPPVCAQSEQAVKAAFLYNFAKYTDWPSDAPKFLIGILGTDPVYDELRSIAKSKRIDGKPISVKQGLRTTSDLKVYHILFVPDAENDDLRTVYSKTKGQSVLVVGETAGAAKRGCAMNFYKQGSKVRFEVNTKRVRESRLKMSSQLLKLAKKVG